MLIYNHDPVTGAFTGSSIADADPLELQLARDAVFAPLAAAAEAALQAARDAADQALQAATDQPGLTEDEWTAARAANDFALSAAAQTYQATLAEARLRAGKVQPAHFLIPANATTTPPPAFGFDQIAVWSDGAWSVRDDHDGDGAPDLPDQPDQPDLAAAVRLERNRRIAVTRWLIDRHRDELALGLTTTLTAEDHLLVLRYVQDLRDVPEQEGFPAEVAWPELDGALVGEG